MLWWTSKLVENELGKEIYNLCLKQKKIILGGFFRLNCQLDQKKVLYIIDLLRAQQVNAF